MEKTTRRRMLLKAAAAAGGAAAGLGIVMKSGAPTAEAQDAHAHAGPPDGPLASATVSFGQWSTDPALDRFPNSSPAGRNVHLLIPNEPTIKAGGSVNFVISGLHNPQIFEDGTEPGDIDTTLTTPTTGTPAGVPIINDPDGRIYRGPDPSLFTRDRVEVVQLTQPGRYLVICGVLPHFKNPLTGEFEMFGYVRVIP